MRIMSIIVNQPAQVDFKVQTWLRLRLITSHYSSHYSFKPYHIEQMALPPFVFKTMSFLLLSLCFVLHLYLLVWGLPSHIVQFFFALNSGTFLLCEKDLGYIKEMTWEVWSFSISTLSYEMARKAPVQFKFQFWQDWRGILYLALLP